MPRHADLRYPSEDRIAGGELGAIIAYDHTRLPPLGDEPGQLTHDTVP